MKDDVRILPAWNRVYRHGAAALPELSIDLADFARIVSRHPFHPREVQRPRDLYLACACALQHRRAVALLESTAITRAKVAIARFDQDPVFVEEALQRLRTHLLVAAPGELPRISEFTGRHDLVSWTWMCAVRVAQNLMREHSRAGHQRAEVRGWELAIDRRGTGDIELDHLRLRYAEPFAGAVRRAFATLPGRDQALLHLYFTGAFKVAQIAQTYGVPRSTAGRWVLRARQGLFHATLRELGAVEGLSLGEVASLWRQILSAVNLSELPRAEVSLPATKIDIAE